MSIKGGINSMAKIRRIKIVDEVFLNDMAGAAFSRIHQHLNSRYCCFMSAFIYDDETEILDGSRDEELENKLKALKFGWISLIGVWKHKRSGRIYEERSKMVVNGKLDDDEEFVKVMLKLGLEDFKQEGILINDGKDFDVRCYNDDGTIDTVGRFAPNKVGVMYSIRKGKPFVFQSLKVEGEVNMSEKVKSFMSRFATQCVRQNFINRK